LATSNSTTNAIRRGPEGDLRDKQKVFCFDDGSRSFQIMLADLRTNELIEARDIKVENPNPSEIIESYIHLLPKSAREGISPRTLYFHFCKEDFLKYDIDTQRTQIINLYPNFTVFWANEFMGQDIVEFRYKQLQGLSS
jgi:hypothetical protein